MRTFHRICIEDYDIVDDEGTHFRVERAREYTTSAEREDGTVMLFSRSWVRVPVRIFAGERLFTAGELADKG